MHRRKFLSGLAAATVSGAWTTARATRPWPPVPSRSAPTYFPNVALRTQDDKLVHFYDDLVRDKIVVFNMMYARCQSICPGTTLNLQHVQRLLGDRVGRDIFMYSITLKPEQDSPQALKEYADAHHVGPGWLFLTGKPDDIECLRRKLGFVDPDPVVDRDTSQHIGVVRIGNDAIGSWTACPALAWLFATRTWPPPTGGLSRRPGQAAAKSKSSELCVLSTRGSSPKRSSAIARRRRWTARAKRIQACCAPPISIRTKPRVSRR